MEKMKTLTVGGVTFDIVDDGAVRFTEQTLTDEQKAQARENIGVTNGVSSWNDLTDKPFYEESRGVEIFPEQTMEGFEYVEGNGIITGASGLFVLETGIQYRVVWDETEYYCKAYETEISGMAAVFIGNEAIVTGVGSEIVEPFAICYIPSYGYNSFTVMDGSTDTSHTIAIYRDESVVKTLEAKYLPMDAIDERIEAKLAEIPDVSEVGM